MAIIQKYWSPRLSDQVTSMKSLSNNTGVVFDVRARDCDMFLDNFDSIKAAQGRRADFDMQRCKVLPSLH